MRSLPRRRRARRPARPHIGQVARSWGSTLSEDADRFRDTWGEDRDEGEEADGATPDNPCPVELAMAAHDVHFAEIAAYADTGTSVAPPPSVHARADPQSDAGPVAVLGGMVWGDSRWPCTSSSSATPSR